MLLYGAAMAVCALSGIGETVLLDFQADWCGPCRATAPAVAKLEAAGFPVRRVNIDQEPQLAAQYGVRSIPCFVVLVDGQERSRQVGAISYAQLRQMATAAGLTASTSATASAAGAAPAAPRTQPVAFGHARQQTAAGDTLARGQSPEGGLLKRIRLPGLGRRSAETAPSSTAGASGGDAPPWQPGATAPTSGAPPQVTLGDAPAAGGGPAIMTIQEPAAAPPASREPDPSDWASSPNHSRPQVFPPSQAASAAPGQDAAFEDRLVKSTVRLRVDDATGHSFGSGTIIDYRAHPSGEWGEALVLTCGHIFRDSKGRGTIRVDRFDHGDPESSAGRLIHYDLSRDVGLVSFRTTTPVTISRLAGPGNQPRQGDPVASVGCDNGGEPGVHVSRITAINSFVGPPNLQIAGQPAVGRSGGGLFDDKGNVIGVCNFADPQDRAGLFADVASAHEALKQVGLTEISQAAAARGSHGDAAPPPAMATTMPRPERPAPSTEASTPTEVIFIVRRGHGAEARREAIFVRNPSQELLNLLAAEERAAGSVIPTSMAVPKPNAKPAENNSNWEPTWR